MRRFLAALALLAFIPHAWADGSAAPQQRTTTVVSGTVTLGATFQSIAAADTNRTGCILQNTSGHVMYVYLGATASATTTNSIIVPITTGIFYCNVAGVVATDQINITTSTTADTWVLYLTK